MVREKKARDIIVEVQNALKDIKNLEVKGERVFDEINIFVQQTGIVKHDIEIGLTSPSMEKIKSSLKLLKDRLKEIEGVEDIGDNADEGEKELKLRVNEYGQSLGLNEGYITSILRGAFLKGEYAKAFNREGLIRVRIEDRYKDNLNELRDFKITTPDGKVVRLKDVCDFYYKKSFVKIFKENGERVVEVLLELI